jgi:deoxyribodipyrimidine photo-lyase
MHVVWFKRDLRVRDHAPLAEAARAGRVLPLYVFEPEVIGAPDHAAQHLEFTRECLAELDRDLDAAGAPLIRLCGSLPEVLDRLHEREPIEGLWSHEETGNAITYARDRRVRAWCREHGVPWHERPQNGVVRRLDTRDRWADRWEERMSQPVVPPPRRLVPAQVDLTGFATDLPAELSPRGTDKPARQTGGRAAAEALLATFLSSRACDYRTGMSSPLTAESACSRLSAHFALGSLSIREATQAARRRRAELLERPEPQRPRGLLAGLASFEGRLHWHCHFMQKLESEPGIEQRAVHPAFASLHDERLNAGRFEAWRRGETGWPMVDACMRWLAATGWLNFRMRAMVMSVSSLHLWNHWREPGLHLAREFLDYEPGIHWPQVQMQSGVTGINAVRAYNPVKQARDHDPDGVFVRRWIPALARVPHEYLFEPWTMPATAQREAGCVMGRDYPAPSVDHVSASREALRRIHAIRASGEVRAQSQAVFEKHGSRRGDRERPTRRTRAGAGPRRSGSASGKPAAGHADVPSRPTQGSLFD